MAGPATSISKTGILIESWGAAPIPVPWTLPTVTPAEAAQRAGRIVMAAASSAARLAVGRLCQRPGSHDIAVEASRMFEGLGSTFAKLGQIVAATPGMFGEPVSEIFRSCLDAGPALAADVVQEAIESEFGRPIDQLFSSFDPEPIGRASLAVVHRATTTQGQPVAVKVLRPGIEGTIAADLTLVMPACKFVADNTGLEMAEAFDTALQGLRQQLAEELDLRNEAATLEHQRDLLDGHGLTYLTVPATVPNLSCRRVLTMELLDGVPVDDARAIAAYGYDPKPRVEELVRYWFTSVIRDGCFHGDIHAGNLLLLRDGRLALIDWGILGRLNGPAHSFFLRVLEGALGDVTAWADMAELLEEVYGPTLTQSLGIAPDDLASLFQSTITPAFTTPFGERTMAEAISQFGPDSTLLNSGKQGPRRPVERLQALARNRRRRRTANAHGGNDSAFNHGMMLMAKQMMFFDLYGHLYLEDMSLLDDGDFYSALLAEDKGRPYGGDGAGTLREDRRTRD
jgi:hypothetical protein